MYKCSFCNNSAIMTHEGYNYCKKCRDEDVEFLLMSKEDKKELLELYQKKLELYEELITLHKSLDFTLKRKTS